MTRLVYASSSASCYIHCISDFSPCYRSWAETEAGLDASNKDDMVNMQKWNVYGMLMPDTMKSYTAKDGIEYLVTANEGDDKVHSSCVL